MRLSATLDCWKNSLPGLDRGADHGDDEQQDGGVQPARQARHRAGRHRRDAGMREVDHRERREVRDHEHDQEPLPVPVGPARHHGEQRTADAPTAAPAGRPKKDRACSTPMNSATTVTALMMNRSADREGSPELPEPGEYQPAVPDSGNRAEPYHHFLAEEKNREKQDQRPEQPHAVVLAHLGIDLDPARVVPAAHDYQARAHDDQQEPELPAPGPRVGSAALEGAEARRYRRPAADRLLAR